ncbi:hypothetical protein [Niveispirillum sp.]|uniref:hypothetical protein n=1 Tax=Niveispirillum sp. TaxID=1917217 RepID=UPI001B6D7ED1|nr:hypothetical protein [Niveispirillum sp.]MBP7339049.1 hypothetical protein [Niveispirillum sp.]
MNAFSPHGFAAAPAPSSSPSADEAMRTRLFDQFNAFWVNASREGVPYDMIGTMSVTAAVYGLLAKHGVGTTAEFLEGMANDVRTGMFTVPPRPN